MTITAAIIIIGNEILSGRTKEANMLWLSGELKNMGITLTECAIVRDDETAIISAVTRLKAQNDYIFTSGGIGPTHDDITSETIAKAFNTELYIHPEAEKVLKEYYKPNEQTEARMKMSKVPKGAKLIANSISAAPGFIIENLFVMAGVPSIFKSMFEQVRSSLKTGAVIKSKSVIAYVREGDIAPPLKSIQQKFPQVEVGSYPFMRDGRIGAELVFTSTDITALNNARTETIDKLDKMSAEYIVV